MASFLYVVRVDAGAQLRRGLCCFRHCGKPARYAVLPTTPFETRVEPAASHRHVAVPVLAERLLNVLHVLQLRDNSEIPSTVVSPVAVDVVNLHAVGWTHDEAVKVTASPAGNVPVTTGSPAVGGHTVYVFGGYSGEADDDGPPVPKFDADRDSIMVDSIPRSSEQRMLRRTVLESLPVVRRAVFASMNGPIALWKDAVRRTWDRWWPERFEFTTTTALLVMLLAQVVGLMRSVASWKRAHSTCCHDTSLTLGI